MDAGYWLLDMESRMPDSGLKLSLRVRIYSGEAISDTGYWLPNCHPEPVEG